MEDHMIVVSKCISSTECETHQYLQETSPSQFDRDTGKYLGSPVMPEQREALEKISGKIHGHYRIHKMTP